MHLAWSASRRAQFATNKFGPKRVAVPTCSRPLAPWTTASTRRAAAASSRRVRMATTVSLAGCERPAASPGRSLEVRPGEKLGVVAELHDPYSPAARCRSKLRFWVSLKVAYVFICEECRGMRTLSARRHPVRFFSSTSGLAACRRNDFLPDR